MLNKSRKSRRFPIASLLQHGARDRAFVHGQFADGARSFRLPMSRHAGPILIDLDITPVVLRIPTGENAAFVNGRSTSRADLTAAALGGRASERNHAKHGDRRCRSELSLGGELCFRVGHRRRFRGDVNALPLRTRLARVRAHSRMSRRRVERPAEGSGSARRLAVSPCDHAQEDAIPAHEIERRADMGSSKAGDGDADQAMNQEKLLGECAALAPDRRQLE